ncbi:hypothetical protein BDP27DRAFT_1221870 [Rhodocollybia butyracea]|uniref:tRNA-specific adenosine deaminase 1 n=1 Tax=Rhodocollybia butyracea TaxID=206335 RepID=A0A9P5PXL1_9AGAR|nr:hypothetical protein BDP27DRAFT_1221870 [Rhodocollybia butyracea]
MLDDEHIASIHALYSKLKTSPQNQYAILSAFYLATKTECKIISLGTGTKCLPESHLTAQGEAVHDSHAEIIARRGAIRWLFEEILREKISGSQWIEQQEHSYRFKQGIELRMYISTVPCGDASTRFLAALQDPEMAALKDSVVMSQPEGTARGRNNYHLYGVLRTKPGRADSPPTLSLSCSDKIASWAFLGIQGTLGARFFGEGVYVQRIVIGEVLSAKDNNLINAVGKDCERALGGSPLDISTSRPDRYHLQVPTIAFTPIPFVHSRSELALCWRADSLPKTDISSSSSLNSRDSDLRTLQVLINGYKRGASPKHRKRLHDDRFLPHICKLSMFRLYAQVCKEIYAFDPLEVHESSRSARSLIMYQKAKVLLKGPSGPFKAWWDSSVAIIKRKRAESIQCAQSVSLREEDPVDGSSTEAGRSGRGLGLWEKFNVDGELVV